MGGGGSSGGGAAGLGIVGGGLIGGGSGGSGEPVGPGLGSPYRMIQHRRHGVVEPSRLRRLSLQVCPHLVPVTHPACARVCACMCVCLCVCVRARVCEREEEKAMGREGRRIEKTEQTKRDDQRR